MSSEHTADFNFDVFQKTNFDPDQPKDWSGETEETIDYSGYTRVDDRNVSVGTAGYAVTYDYSVADSALVYIQETNSLNGTSITDTDNNTWDYVETYIESEYAWRGDGGTTHSNINKTGADRLRSIPDVVGDYGTYTDPSTGETETLHNTFLEIYVCPPR